MTFLFYRFQGKSNEFEVEEDLDVNDQEANSSHFMAILVKCLLLLDKIPYAIKVRIYINNK